MDDGLPRLICKECSKLLTQTYSFNLLCEESDEVLRACLQNKEPTNTDPEVTDSMYSSLKLEDKAFPKEHLIKELSNIVPLETNKEEILDLIKTGNGFVI